MPRLLTEQRQRAIAEVIARDGQATVEDLCQLFDVSPATIRRDLDDLHSQGLVHRTHGGAVRIVRAAPEPPILQRAFEQAEAKRRIGVAAAALVPEGATVCISSGTTTLEVARALVTRTNLTVITNALNVASTLAEAPGITLVVVGGVLRRSELSLFGHLTEQALAELRADLVFIGAQAISIEHGVSADNLAEVMTDRALLSIGARRVVVADHTKFGKFATARVAPLSGVHTLVTDSGLADGMAQQLREYGVELVLA
jgi:DeoR/GlpR family transcriptional regulator of sugar metabolism